MPDDYKWPQKVRRYGISCPFQRVLVVKYERQIDWSGCRIESPEALNQHLREVLLPRLQELILETSSRNYFCKTIPLERMLANPAPHIDEARSILARGGEQEARQFLLRHINVQKKEHFERWWSYVSVENEQYRSHPAFQYLLLRPVFESSTEKDTCAPLPVDAEALAHLFERMGNGRVAPGQKLLSLLCELMAFGAASNGERSGFGSDCRWVVITRGQKNAASRIAALSRGSGWCVASAKMAANYLQASDFHLLVEGGRAVVALRLSAKRAVEVQGKGNCDPGPWWPRILLYTMARAVVLAHRDEAALHHSNRVRQELGEATGELRRLRSLLETQPSKVQFLDARWVRSLAPAESGEENPNRLVVMEAWRACSRADPMSAGLFPHWMECDQATARAVLDAWIFALNQNIGAVLFVPQRIANHPEIRAASRAGWLLQLRNHPLSWNQCPLALEADEEFRLALKSGWLTLLRVEPWRWENCPPTLWEDDEILQELKRGYLTLMRADPLKGSQCPPALQADEQVKQARIDGWAKLVGLNVQKWSEIPTDLHAHEAVRSALKDGWLNFLRLNPLNWSWCPPELQADDDVSRARRSGWLNVLGREPLMWGDCPPELRADGDLRQACMGGWLNLLRIDPRKWGECPPEFAELIEVKRAFKRGWVLRLEVDPLKWKFWPPDVVADEDFNSARKVGWVKLLGRDPSKWDICPESFKLEKSVQEGLRKGWANLLSRAPRRGGDCPPDLLADEEVQRSLKDGWIELIWSDPSKWEHCPPHFQEDAEVRDALRNGWVDLLARDPRAWGGCPPDLLGDQEVRNALEGAWIGVLKRDPLKWRECPPQIQNNEALKNVLKNGWALLIDGDPLRWEQCPECLQSDETLKNVLKNGWVRLIEGDPRRWGQCPECLQSDEALIGSLRNAWADLLHRGSGQLEECPGFLVADAGFAEARRFLRLESVLAQEHPRLEEISKDILFDFLIRKYPLPHYAAACFEVLGAEPSVTRAILGMWRHNSRIERLHCIDALSALRATPWHFGTLSGIQQEHSLIREAAAEGWVDRISSNALYADLVPESLRTHSEVNAALQSVAADARKALMAQKAASRLALAERCIKAVADNPRISDRELRQLGLPKTERAAWKRILALRLRFWKNAVKKEWRVWEAVPESLRQDEGVLEAMRNGLGPQLCQKAPMWEELPECYRNDPCLQRVHRIATRPRAD